ncbi:unnamed protein product [Paramecium sonneborni]|uniref:FKBP12-rapamycin binding domain-containing protein n=1 Tax=Paramecium sonneborni TaxID=65129 RepID=A0A8S1RQ36_9CILI|nr:unnamed protein product [Paramecium sonneborni]
MYLSSQRIIEINIFKKQRNQKRQIIFYKILYKSYLQYLNMEWKLLFLMNLDKIINKQILQIVLMLFHKFQQESKFKIRQFNNYYKIYQYISVVYIHKLLFIHYCCLQIKRLQVLKILDDMKKHSPILVNGALIISEELNRTAILLKEAWREGIQEAWTSFSYDKNKTHLERILRGLHDNMRVKLESLSEIQFHQTYGQEIFEAEAWQQRHLRTEDQVCLCVHLIYIQEFIIKSRKKEESSS